MDTCRLCNKSGLFVRTDINSLCAKCSQEIKRPDFISALEFIDRLTSLCQKATKDTVIVPHRGKKSIDEQRSACEEFLSIVDSWVEYPKFSQAFTLTLVPEERLSGFEHPLFPLIRFSNPHAIDFEMHFSKLKETVKDISTDCLIASFHAYDYSKLFHVVGVTFFNGKQSRQSILKRLGRGYGDNCERLWLERYLFDGEDAVAVYAKEGQIGNIAKTDLPWLLSHWEDYAYISDYEVVGSDPLGIHIRVCVCYSEGGE